MEVQYRQRVYKDFSRPSEIRPAASTGMPGAIARQRYSPPPTHQLRSKFHFMTGVIPRAASPAMAQRLL